MKSCVVFYPHHWVPVYLKRDKVNLKSRGRKQHTLNAYSNAAGVQCLRLVGCKNNKDSILRTYCKHSHTHTHASKLGCSAFSNVIPFFSLFSLFSHSRWTCVWEAQRRTFLAMYLIYEEGSIFSIHMYDVILRALIKIQRTTALPRHFIVVNESFDAQYTTEKIPMCHSI